MQYRAVNTALNMALKLDTASLILQPIHSFFIRSNLSLLMWLARKCLSPCDSHQFASIATICRRALYSPSLPNSNSVREGVRNGSAHSRPCPHCRRVWNQNRKWKQAWPSYRKGLPFNHRAVHIPRWLRLELVPRLLAAFAPPLPRPRNPTTPPKQPYFSLLLLFLLYLNI